MWIQLTRPKVIEVSGRNVKYNPGDWVEVGKHIALLWISEGSAIIPDLSGSTFDMSGVGIITDHKELLCNRLKDELKTLIVDEGAPSVSFDKTILLDSTLPLRTSLLPVGIAMLDTWDIAVPLCDPKILAAHVGTDQERERTKKVIRDLRVPVYNTALMFIKKTEDTIRLIDTWRADGKTDLAFLRALYQIKPLILALPHTWTLGAPLANA